MFRASHILYIAAAGCFLVGGTSLPGCAQQQAASKSAPVADSVVQLPAARVTGTMALEHAIAHRRSVRQYAAGNLTLPQLAQIVWAAQGMTDGSHRAAPSAMARYPVDLYVAATAVDGLAPGIYRYVPAKHGLERIVAGDQRAAVAAAAGGQASVASAPITLIFTGLSTRLSPRPDVRADRFVAVEVGAAAQNVYLQATALELGTVIVGGIDPAAMARVLQLAGDNAPTPIIAMPVGRK